MRIKIYTDGACSGNPGPGGWGAILLFKNGQEQRISGFDKQTTNNRMELLAVIESLNLALQMNVSIIDIYSDSAYVVNAINEYWINKWELNNWKTNVGKDIKNKDLWLKLNSLLKNNKKITLFKIKGHNGHKYNEIADELARSEIIINS